MIPGKSALKDDKMMSKSRFNRNATATAQNLFVNAPLKQCVLPCLSQQRGHPARFWQPHVDLPSISKLDPDQRGHRRICFELISLHFYFLHAPGTGETRR